MKNIAFCIFRFFRRHVAAMISMLFAILLVVFGSEYFIEEKRGVIKIISPIIGLVSGAAIGGVLGWLLGGIGIAAMGGAIGLSAPLVVILGAISFSVFGGFIGSSVALFRMISNPSNFYINLPGLISLLLASVVLFWAFRVAILWFIKKMRTSTIASD